MRRALLILVLLLGAFGLAALAADPPLVESTSTRFNFAQHLVRSADDSRNKGDPAMAGILYSEALKEYETLIAEYPNWDPAVTRFRLDYCREQLAELKRQGIAIPAPAPPGTERPPSLPPAAEPPSMPPLAAALPAPAPPPPGASAANPAAPNADALRHQASALLRAGNTAEARTLLLEALRLNPDDPPARLMIGVAQCTLGNYQDALYVLEPLAEEQPALAAVQLALGAAYFGLGDNTNAERAARQAVAIDDASAEGHYNLARVLLAAHPTNTIEPQAHYLKAIDLGAAADPALATQLGLAP